jgi:hypothetical protein
MNIQSTDLEAVSILTIERRATFRGEFSPHPQDFGREQTRASVAFLTTVFPFSPNVVSSEQLAPEILGR